ncbi:DMT family transporter [Clostridium sp.]|jgi:drug/metabolite transporter (DMT)-like permease|uniref:DMT family transporter n=1 Tax=Clostridium sp. TaxID=1506 RepID=UPI00258899D8|nr:DMT family transporter [Clostridium sp.]MDF2504983.1 DMT(drug/metabolite transporter) superfamily permease [Clostridium sp.]
MYRKKGIVLGLFAGALWGLDGVLMQGYFNKNVVDNNSILIVSIICACVHDGFAGIWIFIKNLISGKIKLYKKVLNYSSIRFLILGSILGGPVGMTGNLLGIQLAGTAYAYSITSCYPVLGVILGTIFLKEKVKILGIIGVILSVIGAGIVGYEPSGVEKYFYIGLACSVLAVIGWALEGIISTYSMNSIDPDIAIGIREIISCTAYIIIIFMLKINIMIIFNNLYVLVIIAASLIGASSYLCWYRSMKLLGASISMSLNITYALWAVLFSWILIGQKITFALLMGSVIITLGTMATISSTKK